jgi:hypothetical protein
MIWIGLSCSRERVQAGEEHPSLFGVGLYGVPCINEMPLFVARTCTDLLSLHSVSRLIILSTVLRMSDFDINTSAGAYPRPAAYGLPPFPVILA